MNAIRVLARPEKDGVLVLTNLPVEKEQLLEIIILTPDVPEEEGLTLSLLQHDPGYAFLWDSAEDLYTEADVKAHRYTGRLVNWQIGIYWPIYQLPICQSS